MTKMSYLKLPRYAWCVVSLGKGKKQYFQYDGIGCLPCHEKMTIITQGTFKHKYLNPDWWYKNSYRRKDMNDIQDNRSDIYYLNSFTRLSSIIDVINRKIDFTEWANLNNAEFWKQSPTLISDVFDELIAKINKKYKLTLKRDITKPSYESYIQLVSDNPKERLILTWDNCD